MENEAENLFSISLVAPRNEDGNHSSIDSRIT